MFHVEHFLKQKEIQGKYNADGKLLLGRTSLHMKQGFKWF